jgi:hypothetical protein
MSASPALLASTAHLRPLQHPLVTAPPGPSAFWVQRSQATPRQKLPSRSAFAPLITTVSLALEFLHVAAPASGALAASA